MAKTMLEMMQYSTNLVDLWCTREVMYHTKLSVNSVSCSFFRISYNTPVDSVTYVPSIKLMKLRESGGQPPGL